MTVDKSLLVERPFDDNGTGAVCRAALKMLKHGLWIVSNAAIGTNQCTPACSKKADALKIGIGNDVSGTHRLKNNEMCASIHSD